MPKPTVLISIDTYADTATEAFGKSFIQSLYDEDARLVPEWLSTTDTYKDPYVGIDDFLANWWAVAEEYRVDGKRMDDAIQGPSWKRKSALASRGMIEHGFINRTYDKISGLIWYECRWAKDVDFNHLFNVWAGMTHPYIAMLHLFTEPELQWQDYAADMSFRVGSFGNGTRPGLPNMGWAMAYGKSYAGEVDAARIRAAGFAVDEREGVTIVRVTDNLSDVVDNFAHFSQRRAELKALFRPDLFWIKEEPGERMMCA
jgi:hypothetical protein